MSEALPVDKMDEKKPYVYEEENQFKDFLNFLNEYFELEKKWANLLNFLMAHPIASLFLITTLAICSVPVVFFVMFVFGTLAISMVGFLIFEGTALTIGALVLGGALFVASLFSVGFATFLLSGYYVIRKCLGLLGVFRDTLTSSDSETSPDSTCSKLERNLKDECMTTS